MRLSADKSLLIVAVLSLACGVQSSWCVRWARNEMMSTAILLKAGAEPPAVSLGSADRDVPKGSSFAESLNERVGDTMLLGEKISTDESATAPLALKSAEVAKRSNEFAEVRAVSGEKSAADRLDLKNPVVEKIVEPRAATAMVPQSKALLGNFRSNEVESPIQKEVVDLSPGRDDRQSAQVGELKDGGLVPIADACKEDLAVIGSGSPPVVTKEQKTEPTGKAAIASTKKPVRSQESAVGPKTGAKNIMPVESGSTIQQKLDLANPPEGGVIPSGVAAGAFAIPRNEVEATSKGFSETSGVGISSAAPASAASSGSARDEAARGVRSDTTGVEAAVAPVDGSIASPKSSVGLEALATSPVGSDGDGKIQSAPVSVQGFSHVMLSGVEASSSSNPLLVVHGSAQGDLVAATRSQVGDVLQHPSGLASVMRGEEGPVGAPIGEAPRTLAATSTSLEVGVQNGMHGWLKIRAEMTDGGVVNASVSTASVAGQELLHRELPALTAYLAEEKVVVNAVVVQAPLAAAADARGSSGMDGAGGQASERSNGGDERNQDLGKTVSNDPAEATTYQSLLGGVEDGSLQFAGYGSGGGWLSVRA